MGPASKSRVFAATSQLQNHTIADRFSILFIDSSPEMRTESRDLYFNAATDAVMGKSDGHLVSTELF